MESLIADLGAARAGLGGQAAAWVAGLDWARVSVALVILGALSLLRRPFGRLIVALLRWLARRLNLAVEAEHAEAVRPAAGALVVGLAVLIANDVLDLPEPYAALGANAGLSVIAFAFFWAVHALIDPLAGLLDPLRAVLTGELVTWLVRGAKLAAVVVGAGAVLQVWGIEVGPILAGLGLLGVAVALGAQDLFKNLIAGLSIIVERRFATGDWIKAEGVVEGTVVAVGFRSTLVRRFDLAPVHVPNAMLSDNSLINFSGMAHRRIYWSIGVVYSTTAEQLMAIRGAIEAYIEGSADFVAPPEASRHVRIDSFGASSIDILVYCFSRSAVYAEYLEVKERLALRIKDIVLNAGSDFAFPSRTVYVEAAPTAGPDRFRPLDPSEEGSGEGAGEAAPEGTGRGVR